MNRPHHPLVRSFLVASLLGPLGAGGISQARDDEEPENKAPAPPRVVFRDENFDQWVFGDGLGVAEARTRLGEFLETRIQTIDQICGLTEVQREKVRLAGRGDIKRTFHRIDEMRRRFHRVKDDGNQLGGFLREIAPLRVDVASGPFGDGSLFAKTLHKTLDREQATRHREAVRIRASAGPRAFVDSVVERESTPWRLSARQKEQFAEVLWEEARHLQGDDRFRHRMVMLRAATLPDAKLRPVFDDDQWLVLQQRLKTVRSSPLFLPGAGSPP